MKLYKELFIKPCLIILGFLTFWYYIWLLFIRTRVPKVIPFESLSFYTLCFIVYIIYILIKKNQEENPLVTKLLELFYKPLDSFDDFIKLF